MDWTQLAQEKYLNICPLFGPFFKIFDKKSGSFWIGNQQQWVGRLKQNDTYKHTVLKQVRVVCIYNIHMAV
jgi:hypothetical protein